MQRQGMEQRWMEWPTNSPLNLRPLPWASANPDTIDDALSCLGSLAWLRVHTNSLLGQVQILKSKYVLKLGTPRIELGEGLKKPK